MFILDLIIFIISMKTSFCQFITYMIYNGTSIAPQAFSYLNLSEPFQVSKSTEVFSCVNACNMYADCEVVTLNKTNNICTMFSNRTTLSSLTKSLDSVLFSKHQLPECPNITHYIDMTNKICKLKKSFQENCETSNDCVASPGLTCNNSTGTCQCN
jgi:hypothetical protein